MKVGKKTDEEIRKEIFCKEFPWLKKYLDHYYVEKISVSRINQTLIDSQPNRGDCFLERLLTDEPDVDEVIGYQEMILLLDIEGKKLAEVEKLNPSEVLNLYGFFPLLWYFIRFCGRIDETVSDALVRLGESSGKVSFILSLKGGNLVIYKEPRGFNLNDWEKQVRSREENTRRQQLTVIGEQVQKELKEDSGD